MDEDFKVLVKNQMSKLEAEKKVLDEEVAIKRARVTAIIREIEKCRMVLDMGRHSPRPKKDKGEEKNDANEESDRLA